LAFLAEPFIKQTKQTLTIDLWLSHAPSTHSDKHGAMAAVTLGDISQEAIGDFWRQKIIYHLEVT